jgi:formate dehydrogenase iron-sulfur subunit
MNAERPVVCWVPQDAAAVSVGADDVAVALADAGAQVRRNGSRGLLWAEPLVEVETGAGRVGFAEATPLDVPRILAVDTGHPNHLGIVDDHPWLTGQQRVSFARVGVIEPTSLASFAEHGGYAGLRKALSMAPAEVVEEVIASGLRGRGGAGFPAGIKWRTVAGMQADQKFVCCNFERATRAHSPTG